MSEQDNELQEGLLSASIRKAPPTSVRGHRISRLSRVALIWPCILILFVFYLVTRQSRPHHYPAGLRPPVPVDVLPVDVLRRWAQYAPYHALAEYQQPPAGCRITQVNILQRHGARFPTTGASQRILTALEKLTSVKHIEDRRLDFLKTFLYDLGVNELVRFGADEAYDSGREAFLRYKGLVSNTSLPFVRSDISQRDIDSATNWTAGFASASQNRYHPKLSVILDSAANDTLDDSQCPAAGTSDAQTSAWLSIFEPNLTAQLNNAAPGANLIEKDVYNLMTLCPFHSLTKMKKSPWCTLFESMDGAFNDFEYVGDLDKFYYTGYGQALGRVQGVGYVNELLARLTESPVRDHTQTNRTLDGSPVTFPLDRAIYVDFSHDNQMIPIYSAMGLFRQNRPLDPTKPDPKRTWRTSAMVPFSARMVVERLSCRVHSRSSPDVMVRILVQDEIQMLDFCAADLDRMCTLDAFVESQSYARNDGEGDWEKCFASES